MWLTWSLSVAVATIPSPLFAESTPPLLLIDSEEKSCGGAFFDLDDDGDWDLVAGATEGARLARNDGGGIWTDLTAASPMLGSLGSPQGLLVGDLSGDGWPELVRVDASAVTFGLHQGAPQYTWLEALVVPLDDGVGAVGSALLDWNNDGWLDVFVHQASHNVLLLNPADGSAAFTVVDLAMLGMTNSAADYSTVADWSRDGYTDVVSRAAIDNAFLNEAGIGWRPAPGVTSMAPFGAYGTSVFCDLHTDGDLDLVWTIDGSTPLAAFGWEGATGVFSEWATEFVPTLSAERSLAVASGDLDSDGTVDLVIGADGEDLILMGPTWDPYGFAADISAPTIAVALADVDSDGDLDAYLSRDRAFNRLQENVSNPTNWIQIRPRANLTACPDEPVLRDDLGAMARVLNEDGEPVSPLLEVSGGYGRGQTAWPVLHFGGVDPLAPHLLEIDFAYGGSGPQVVELPAGSGPFSLSHDDPDGDGISTAQELADGDGTGDIDGDGLSDWLDRDADADGTLDLDERGAVGACDLPRNADGDERPDYLDVDSDNDGASDQDEREAGTDPLVPEGVDADADGYFDGADCDDANPEVHPDALEICNGIDDDCDPVTPDGPDLDGDGSSACDDCDDSDAARVPGADEICDNLDNDCDGGVDEDPVDGMPMWGDDDEDGFGVGDPVLVCDLQPSLAVRDGDCDDTDGLRHPSAAETRDDGIDQDCDGSDLVTSLEGSAGLNCGCASGGRPGGWLLWVALLGRRLRR